MKIIFDDIIYSLQKNGGGSLYWTQILKKQPEDVIHYIYKGAEKNFFYKPEQIKNSIELSSFLLPVKRYLNLKIKWEDRFIFHSSYYRYCCNPKAINITTVHDFTYERFRTDWKANFHKIQKRNAVMHSDGVICISESTMKDFKEYYPDYKGMLKVINNAYDTHSYYLQDKLENKRSNIVLFVGSRTDYKRFDIAVDLIEYFKDLQLYIIGGGKLTQKEIEQVEKKIPGRYKKLGYISNDDLRELYNKAFFICYPSEYEGLGCPILEAQACGCPVVCQYVSSIPDVSNEIAIFIGKDMSKNREIVEQLYDTVYYKKLQIEGLKNVKRFSWDKTAIDTYKFYEEVYENKR